MFLTVLKQLLNLTPAQVVLVWVYSEYKMLLHMQITCEITLPTVACTKPNMSLMLYHAIVLNAIERRIR